MQIDHHVKSELKGAGWGLFWWSAAIALHVAIISLIIFWEPLREWYLSKGDPEANLKTMTIDRLRGYMKEIVAIHTRRLLEMVKEEHKYLTELESMRNQRYTTYVAAIRKAGKPAEKLDQLGSTGPSVPDFEQYDLFALYDLAQDIEKKAYATYRQMRIVELSRIQALTFEAAAEVVQVSVPTHQPITKELFFQDITGVKDPRFAEIKNEIQRIKGEVAGMTAGIKRMIDVGKGLMGEDIGGITVIGQGGVFDGSGGGRWGSGIGPSLSPEEFYPGNRDGDFSEDWRPVFGRKLMDDGRPAEWMYIDTWYIIGPFPNPQRQYMDHVFPPESVVDLDASYVGKDGRKLTWQWMKVPDGKIMIAPHVATNFAVWYAFTEVWSDKPQTKWVSFGSDDYSKAWLNGEPVWTSGKTPHRWIPDRGFRKLNFRRGHNQLLLKLENAGGTTGFSVVIYTGSLTFKPSNKVE